MANKTPELKGTTIGLMFSVALFFDTLQAVFQIAPVLGQILAGLIAIFAFLTLWLWFRLHGIKFSTPKRSAVMAGGFLIELIPILNILPAWTLAVTLIVADLKIKENLPGAIDESVENKKAA